MSSRVSCKVCAEPAQFKNANADVYCSRLCAQYAWLSRSMLTHRPYVGNALNDSVEIVDQSNRKYVTVRQLGVGSSGVTYLAKEGANFWVLKTFRLARSKIGAEFVKEVAIAKILKQSSTKDKQLCTVSAQCNTRSFVAKQPTGWGVVASPSTKDPDFESLNDFISDTVALDELTASDDERSARDLQRRMLFLAADILDDVARFHENKIYHRDLKPENTLVNRAAWENPSNAPSTLNILIDFNLSYSPVLNIDSKLFYSKDDDLLGIEDVQKNQAQFLKGVRAEWTANQIPSFVTKGVTQAIGTLLYLDPAATSTKKKNDEPFSNEQLEQFDLFATGVTLFALFSVNSGIIAAEQVSVIEGLNWRPPSDEDMFGNDIVQALVSSDTKKRLSARKWHTEVLARLKKLGPIEIKA